MKGYRTCLNHFTPTSEWIFSILLSTYFLWYWQAESGQSRAFQVIDYLLYSPDLYKWFVQEIVWTQVHFVIYGHEWCFEGFQNCTRLRLVQFENFQNITSDHKSRNARAGSYDFLFIIFSTKLLHRATLHVLRTTKNTSMGSKMLTCFIWTNQKCNVVTGKSSVKFLKVSQKILQAELKS